MTTLYIHIPFCQKKCNFCSFVVAIGKEDAADAYLDCLEGEANFYHGAAVKTIYIGGGTPTFMPEAQLGRLFEIIKKNFSYAPASELTIEANPENIDKNKAKLLRENGINRISLGVQSLQEKYLKYLGRVHNRARALEAFEILRKEGFSNINVDMMYSFPQQTLEEIKKDIKEAASLGSDHISFYALTIEEGSKFYHLNVALGENEILKQQYELLTNGIEESGFSQYEVSNFAKQGKESLHNRHYWEGGNYIGLGVGAHSHSDGIRSWNTASIPKYISKIQSGQKAVEGTEQLTVEKRFMEGLLFGLRMNEDVCLEDLEKKYAFPLPIEKTDVIENCVNNGLLMRKNSHLKTTFRGRLLLDEICARLI